MVDWDQVLLGVSDAINLRGGLHVVSVAPRLAGVHRAERCDLSVSASAWDFAQDNRAAIDAHWARRKAESPGFFNGTIFLLEAFELAGPVFRGRFLKTEFKSYLYWREAGFPDAGVHDAFGSALIRSSDGRVILGRQRPGNINSGLAYLPGGFIDARDVTAQGSIRIDDSILREVAEETGLAAAELTRLPGYYLTFAGPLISMAAELRASLPSDALVARIAAHIGQDPQSELTEAVPIGSVMDMQGVEMPDYARILLDSLFKGA